MLSGFHAVEARLAAAPRTIEIVYVDDERRDARMRELRSRLDRAGIRWAPVDGERLRGLAPGAPHQGVVALCEPWAPQFGIDDLLDSVGPTTLLLLLDGITDPRNLGACLRSADAAGVTAVVLPRDRSAKLTPEAARAAAGAAEAVPLVAVTNLARSMRELRDAGVRIVGAAGEAGRAIYDVDLTGPVGWAVGAEGGGLRRLTRENCDELASIPLAGTVASLNVAVAAAVCLFETVRQRRPVAA